MVFIQEMIYLKKDVAYVTNLDECNSIGAYSITFYVNGVNVAYFVRFGVEHIPEEIKKLIGNKNIIANIYRIQAYNSIMCEYFCIKFIIFMLKSKIIQIYFLPTNMKRMIK